MATKALLVRLEAEPGKENAVVEFLRSALPLVEQERGTKPWMAVRFGPSAIGVSPDGRAAKDTNAKGFGEGWTKDAALIACVVENLGAVVDRLRERITLTEDADPVTEDLLIAITARPEQLHWIWQAQV
ncbi:hypothetical protein [Nocardia beijingensis]|uniref:hypothetical protein n=1 Tax=Nocardia beijingensis TaxID=95162 RepID=UPI001E489756|nr:hypothetical protein [Nocardia beijingensis]